jgi:outer membrane immunogenic protein
MKKFLLGGAGFVATGLLAIGIVGPAVAADMAVPYTKVPVLIPAMYDWSGIYVGLNGGWGTESHCFDVVTAAGLFVGADGCHSASGGVAGGQIGFRWQTGAWVFGIETQGNWANLQGSSVSLTNPANIDRSRIDAFGLFTGQIGYAWNTTLLYLKGGAAVIADRNDIVSGGLVVATAPGDNRWGGTIGGGVEFSFAPDWSAAVEYDHLFVGNYTTTFNATTGGVFSTDRIRGDSDMFTVRVNYRWGGPIIPKYW